MTPTEAVVADSAAATDSRDLLERLMIAFKYISAELDPYLAQVHTTPSASPRALHLLSPVTRFGCLAVDVL
jgi:hypothetical protein